MATLKHVADLAGVSPGTVSRVLNRARGVEELSPDCIARVETAARQLGYRANFIARSFKQGRSFGIGIVSHPPSSNQHGFCSALTVAADVAVRQAGYHSVVVSPSGAESGADCAERFLREGRIDGVVIPYFLVTRDDRARLARLQKPIVMLGWQEDGELPSVRIDDAAGVRAAVQHVAELGHRVMLWVGPEIHERAAVRSDACLESAQKFGMNCRVLQTPTAGSTDLVQDIDSFSALIAGALRVTPRPTAVVCFNDVLALAAYAAAAQCKLSIPSKLSVIGFDDVYGHVTYPAMTTVSHMLPELTARAVHLAIAMSTAENPEQFRTRTDLIQPEIIVRKSTARPSTHEEGENHVDA